jgi:hypothetical protein
MICEDVRQLLPEVAERGVRLAGPVEEHIAACEPCSVELADYRVVLGGLAGLADVTFEPSASFVERVVAAGQGEMGRWSVGRRLLADPRVRYAAISVGGAAVVGAAAVRVVRRRSARRSARLAATV